ncbi:PP2C family serine/threonine-protein phosphatase [Paenisporosarcina cavernae]|uniref:Phosphoserine phosphatase n=1 Tax=Paenisporosarcina cavernae TaxID=2320858 RepID=A0A385YU01_9BACL|nr:PP2C family serine/threonine-protein phosphatase [Paenisporosarcina cavernae]AYC30355.1 phosphoserine phosphatase [Paenisporosarcina cavernae]
MNQIIHPFLEVFVYQEAKEGNDESGDAYFTFMNEEYFICAIADGLGNGPGARRSSEIIPQILEEYHHESIDSLLLRSNEQMFQKRGAAVAIVKVDFKEKTIAYSCVGNIKFYLTHQTDEKMVYPLPVMGYLSGRPTKIHTQTYKYQPGDLFLMHSDGVVLNNPRTLLRNSRGANDLHQTLIQTIEHGDDATFIAGSLLQ